MTVAVTTLRSTIATALSNPAVWQVFSFPPASPLANSVVVEPDDPYIVPSNNQHITVAPLANFRLKLYLAIARQSRFIARHGNLYCCMYLLN
jgi:hypothetical protein